MVERFTHMALRLQWDAVLKLDLINHKQSLWTPGEERNMIILVMDVLVVGNGTPLNYHSDRTFIYRIRMQ